MKRTGLLIAAAIVVGVVVWAHHVATFDSSFRESPLHIFAPATPRDGIAELRVLAKKRHMWWKIICTDWQSDPNSQFLAELCEANCNLYYKEEGAKRAWLESGPTQAGAALQLVDSVLRGEEPNPYTPAIRDRPVEKSEPHHECPPPLSGGPE